MADEYLSTDPHAGEPTDGQTYLSTDPNAGDHSDERSWLARTVDALSAPTAPGRWLQGKARDLSTWITTPHLDESRPVAMAKGFLGGASEGAGDTVASITSPLGAAAAFSGFGADKAGAAGFLNAARAMRGVEAASGAAFGARGLEQAASARTVSEKALGIAQAAAGALGVRGGTQGFLRTGARVVDEPRPVAGYLRAGPRFVGTDAGVIAPVERAGDIPPAPDASYVRGVPAEYARRAVAGYLRAGPGFVGNESGAVAPIAHAGELPVTRAVDASYVRGVPAEYARREVRGALPPGPAFLGQESGPALPAESAYLSRDPMAGTPSQAPDASMVRSVPAAPLAYTMEGRKLVPRQFSSDVDATAAPPVDLTEPVAHALRWIREDMTAMPFTSHTFRDIPRGQGSTLELSPGAAGAPIYQAIVGNLSRASRADVLRSIENLFAGKRTPTGDLVLGVATDLAEGDARLRRLMVLPPEAGNVRASAGGGEGSRVAETLFDRFAADVDALSNMGGSFEPGERGAINPTLAARVGLGGAGAAYGAATGDDPKDRLARAALFGAAGFAAPSLLAEGGGFLRTVTPVAGRRGLSVADEARVPVEPAGQIPSERLRTMPTLTPNVQEAADAILEQYGGFVRQRRGVQSVARTEGLADRVTVPTDRPLPAGTALNAERLRAYQNATATILDKQQRLQARVTSGAASPGEQLELEQARSQAEMLTASFRGAAAEAGRALHILRYQARILASADPEAMREAAQASQHGMTAQARSYFYANILSGIATHERNILGNLSNAAFNLVAHPGAVAADMVRAQVTEQPRSVFLGELPERVAGTVAALPRAFSNALRTLRTGIPPADVTSFDRPIHREFAGGGANPFNYPSRALEAADDFFATVAQQQTLYGAAFAAAKREGLSGDALLRRVADLKVNPSDAILSEVEQNRARLLFREKPGAIADAVQAAKRHLPALDFVVPFVRVPANIIRQGFEASPAGFAMSAARQGGRAGADAMGRAAVGTLALAPLAYWAALGKITGDAPGDPAERAAFYESGKRPNSVQIGNTWYSYQPIQPLNVPLSVVANAFQTWREAKGDTSATADQLATEIIGRTAGSLLDQSFLSGLSALVDALSDPQRYGRAFVQQLATGAVPFSGALRTVTQTTDPYVRAPKSLTEGVQAIIPGESTKLPPRLTRFGEPVTRGSESLNVFRPSAAVTDPVAHALEAAGINLRPAQGPKEIAVARGQRVPLQPRDQFAVGRAEGQTMRRLIEQVMQTPTYENARPGLQRQLLERAISQARAGVRQQAGREALLRQMNSAR